MGDNVVTRRMGDYLPAQRMGDHLVARRMGDHQKSRRAGATITRRGAWARRRRHPARSNGGFTVGFASGAVTFRRYFLAGQHPRTLTEAWARDLPAHAFGRHSETSADGVELGWIRPTHLFDVHFDGSDVPSVGRFVHLAMRLDRTTPPPAIVRSYQLMEEAAALEAEGTEHLSRAQRREAKEAAVLRAREEARNGAFRRVGAVPVLIDPADGVAYLGSLGTLIGDRFVQLFSDTFGVTLVPATSEEVAIRALEQAGGIEVLETLAPALLEAPPDASDDGAWDGVNRTFLGREFLTWLWYEHATESDALADDRGRPVQLAFHRTLQLECPWGLTGRTAVRCDGPASAPEARAALACGKMPTRAGLLIGANSDDWGLTLDGPNWTVSGARLPQPDEADADARLEERFMRIRELARLLDTWYAGFLRLRVSADWSRRWGRVRAWAARSTPAATPELPRRATA